VTKPAMLSLYLDHSAVVEVTHYDNFGWKGQRRSFVQVLHSDAEHAVLDVSIHPGNTTAVLAFAAALHQAATHMKETAAPPPITKALGSDPIDRFWWMRWFSDSNGDPRPVVYPAPIEWWWTGQTEDGLSTICALVKAPDDTTAWAQVKQYWPEAKPDFADEKPARWRPPSDFRSIPVGDGVRFDSRPSPRRAASSASDLS